jgi:hypothetical protein
MNGEPLTDDIRSYEKVMRPLSDWTFYQEFPQRILNNLGRRPLNTDDLSMQAQLYWVVTRLLGEIELLREGVHQQNIQHMAEIKQLRALEAAANATAHDLAQQNDELEEQLSDCQAERGRVR